MTEASAQRTEATPLAEPASPTMSTPLAQATPLAVVVTKKEPSHWWRSLSNTAIVLLGTGGLHLDTGAMIGKGTAAIDKATAWQAVAAARNAVVISKLDSLLLDERDTVYIRDTIYYKLP